MSEPEKDKLAEELQQRSAECRARALRDYYAAYTVLSIALGASLVTTVSVAAEWLPKGVTATLAALPAAAVGLTAVFKFEARSDWWWAQCYKLDALRHALLYQGRDKSDVSREMDDFLAKHNEIWPRFGKLPGSGSSHDAA
jgi:DNA segregation ATPase FtsK/SpoIIIE-like protein